MIDYAEKRNFQRMQMDCSMQFNVAGEELQHQARVINLSASGVLFIAPIELATETHASILLSPVNTITPPMSADIVVIQCVEKSEQEFQVAARIVRID
jgi:hypothetical protein